MSGGSPKRRVLLVRHTSVDEACRGLCYGRSDVALSTQGVNEAQGVAAVLHAEHARQPISKVFHSGLTRARQLAELLAIRCGVPATADPDLAEMHFGEWEMCDWKAIHSRWPGALDRLLAEPATFAPPGGETVFAMRDRVQRWYNNLPQSGLIVAIAHGGPISALRGTLTGLPPVRWPSMIPALGELVELH